MGSDPPAARRNLIRRVKNESQRGGLGLGYVLGLAPSMLGGGEINDRNAQYIPLK